MSDALIRTNRPYRCPPRMTVSVGPETGMLRGADDKVVQAGIDYLARLGGGTLELGPGTYELRNTIYLRPGITLRGTAGETVLRKAPGVISAVARDADWYEYAVQVADPSGFRTGDGIMLRSPRKNWGFDVCRATIVKIEEEVLFLDRRTEKDFLPTNESTAASIFPMVTGWETDDVAVEDIILDGNREQNETINGNYAGAVFLQYCNRWTFRNVTARNYNGDGFSFQVCDDIEFVECSSLDNKGLGFHPGSGAQRPIFRTCVASGNSQGLFFCWGVSNGLAEGCLFSNNSQYGISIGHRDTDGLIRNCQITGNGEVGILFRDEHREFLAGHRNRIEACTITGNGAGEGYGVDVRGPVREVDIRHCSFEGGPGIKIGAKAGAVLLQDNTFGGCTPDVLDLRG